MCTAISVTVKDHYFGRNLDFEHTFGEKITITPRKFSFAFRNGKKIPKHYAIIGMALPYNNYPLYFDAINEKGLGMAGLYFPDNSYYERWTEGKDNIASFELIPWILAQCGTAEEAGELLKKINITDDAFDENLTPSPLHWIISDKHMSLTVEQTKEGLTVYENSVGILTNNPEFDIQLFNLKNYLSVSPNDPKNEFSDKINLNIYSRGMGGLGLPGDLSSMSRFVKACYTKLNTIFSEDEKEIVQHFFNILYSVYQQKGCVRVGDGYEITNYSSCCNTDKGIYYYTTYNNSNIRAVDMNKENLEENKLIIYPIDDSPKITFKNS